MLSCCIKWGKYSDGIVLKTSDVLDMLTICIYLLTYKGNIAPNDKRRRRESCSSYEAALFSQSPHRPNANKLIHRTLNIALPFICSHVRFL